jgi:protein phosphatase 2C family protein 2/3
MSADGGEKIIRLSKDHKPEDEDETKRIEGNGGKIYQNSSYVPDGNGGMTLIVGPFRAFPGRLSVSRTIGDIEAKLPHLGGNPGVVIATPDIYGFKIRNNHDYIMLGCDGIFEKLENQDVNDAVWDATKPKGEERGIHQKLGSSVDAILQFSAFKKSFDNITAVLIAFENYDNVSGTMSGNTARHAIEEDVVDEEVPPIPL